MPCPGSQVSEAAEVWVKSSPTGFLSFGAPGCEPSGAKRVSCSQALGQAAPVWRTLEKHGSVGPLLSGQACLWPCCYGGCLKSPSGPRLLKAPAQRWPEFRGNSTAPSAKHAPGHLSSGSWHLPGPGSCSLFCSPHLPTAPQCPGTPTSSRAEPTRCSEDTTAPSKAGPHSSLTVAAGSHLQTSMWTVLCPSSPVRLPLRSCCAVV